MKKIILITLFTMLVFTLKAQRYHYGHEYVDLGLSVKWATCNVGANSPEQYGDYFAWGETEPKNYYDWNTYKYCNGDASNLTKYSIDAYYYGINDGKTELFPLDDAANVNWGGNWRMPTREELIELALNCYTRAEEINYVKGFLIISKINGNYIFIPSAGAIWKSNLDREGEAFAIWSSTLDNASANANNLYYSTYTGELGVDELNRCLGVSIRPVCP